MPALAHSLLLTLSASLAYFWIQTPSLKPYSLQAFALTVLLYFIIKRVNKAKIWHILPTSLSIETALATFAFLMLIGSTGNFASFFYPLTYIHLFFIVFSSQPGTSIYTTMVVMLFHYALSTDNLTKHDIVSLLTMPVIMFFFLFAKQQHEEVLRERSVIRAEEQELEDFRKESSLINKFLLDFLKPKIEQINTLLQFPQDNQTVLNQQLQLIKLEIDKIMSLIQIKKKS